MRHILLAAVLLPLTAIAVQAADSATVVLDRHVAMMKKGDLNGVLADYADNAVIVTPHGVAPGQKDVSGSDVFVGKANFRKLFVVLTDKDHVPGNRTMQTSYESIGPDTTLMRWVQFKGQPNQISGTDVWVIRDGKVLFQSVLVDAAKK